MLKRTEKRRNGEMLYTWRCYECDVCKKELPEEWGRAYDEEHDYCFACGFKAGAMTNDEYVATTPYGSFNYTAAIDPHGEIVFYRKRKDGLAPWERGPQTQRFTPEYVAWRKDVFLRDNYTCRVCSQVGGQLNAHHVLSYIHHASLRYDLDNGITLCETCHKEWHKVHGRVRKAKGESNVRG